MTTPEVSERHLSFNSIIILKKGIRGIKPNYW